MGVGNATGPVTGVVATRAHTQHVCTALDVDGTDVVSKVTVEDLAHAKRPWLWSAYQETKAVGLLEIDVVVASGTVDKRIEHQHGRALATHLETRGATAKIFVPDTGQLVGTQ